MRTCALFLCVLLCVAAAPASSPGRRWAVTIDFKVDTVNGEPSDGSKKVHEQFEVCSRLGIENDLRTMFEPGLPEGVELYNFVAADGHISFDAIQKPLPGEGSFDFHAEGTYDERNLRIDIQAQGVSNEDDHLRVSGAAIGTQNGEC